MNGCRYKENIYILLERKDNTVLLGRQWITNKRTKIINDNTKTLEQVLDALSQEKNNGIKEFECELRTADGKKVVGNPYALP